MSAYRRPPAGRCALVAALVALGPVTTAAALDLALPEGAELVRAEPPVPGSHDIATGVWTGSDLPVERVAGTIGRRTWTLPAGSGASVAALADAIARSLREDGAEILLACADTTCGGFDFRRRLDLGRSPEMLVDIGNFHYVAAREAEDTLAVTVSRGGDTLFVHAVAIRASDASVPLVAAPAAAPPEAIAAPPPAEDMASRIARLPETGAVTLDDLSFRTGASELSGRDYPSLIALASFLADNPKRRIVLVGHTDMVGSLEGNIALSRARAEAVRAYLIEAQGVEPERVTARGIGYLAPRATNETAAGREANRRVEALLLPLE
jgi:OOP family OmpA-OmpF porin